MVQVLADVLGEIDRVLTDVPFDFIDSPRFQCFHDMGMVDDRSGQAAGVCHGAVPDGSHMDLQPGYLLGEELGASEVDDALMEFDVHLRVLVDGDLCYIRIHSITERGSYGGCQGLGARSVRASRALHGSLQILRRSCEPDWSVGQVCGRWSPRTGAWLVRSELEELCS